MLIDMRVDRVAPTRVTVLLDGGSDDERAAVARALHDRSPRGTERFETIDCVGTAGDALACLFGASVDQRVSRATGLGTLYVANVEAMSLWLQVLFLRFLDAEGRPRVVVSTRTDLAAAAAEGSFLPNLSERLRLVRIKLGGDG